MSFDIYGNNLRGGHCEVHPHVHEEYPCSVCLAESASRHQSQPEPDYAAMQELWDLYWRNAPEMKPIREALLTQQPENGGAKP